MTVPQQDNQPAQPTPEQQPDTNADNTSGTPISMSSHALRERLELERRTGVNELLRELGIEGGASALKESLASLAQLREAQLTEEQKRQQELETLKADLVTAQEQATTAQLEALRVLIASEKGLPAQLAGRLAGDTRDDIETDADKLLELVNVTPTPPRAPKLDGGAGLQQHTESLDVTDYERQLAAEMKVPIEKWAARKAEKAERE